MDIDTMLSKLALSEVELAEARTKIKESGITLKQLIQKQITEEELVEIGLSTESSKTILVRAKVLFLPAFTVHSVSFHPATLPNVSALILEM